MAKCHEMNRIVEFGLKIQTGKLFRGAGLPPNLVGEGSTNFLRGIPYFLGNKYSQEYLFPREKVLGSIYFREYFFPATPE